MIAGAVALLPFAAVRYGSGDIGSVRRAVHQMIAASAGYSVFIVGPIMAWLSPWLAESLAESPRTAEFAVFALFTVPLGCLLSSTFLLCRPVFEAMGRGRPGLVMAILRYGALMLPLAWSGMFAAQRLGYPAIDGLVVGLLAASALSSLTFYVWMRRALGAMTGG